MRERLTREEIKEQVTMRDVLERYGLRSNRAGFIRCPFHTGDDHASLKVYDRDFHCFACGANGDIFTFVQKMEHVSFREVFQSLGGTYRKPTFSSNLAVYRSQKCRAMAEKQQQRSRETKKLCLLLITVYRRWLRRSEPLSDAWCDSYNALQKQLYIYETMEDGG